MVALNPVESYLAAHHDELGLGRLGIARRPCCVLLTPGFRRSRHVIALVLPDGRPAPALVAKLPRRACDAPGLAREAENLRALERAFGERPSACIPALLAFAPGPPRALLIESALEGTPLSPAMLRRGRLEPARAVGRWLEGLGVATAEEPRDGAWYERLVRAPLRSAAAAMPALRPIVELTLERTEQLVGAGLPLVFEHGDLCHPNLLLRDDGQIGVIDWERAQPAGLPGHDLFFFLAYAADAGRDRSRRVEAAFFGRRPWAWQVAEAYARRLGIDSSLLRPLLAVSCARAVAASATPLPRHMVLWRAALAEEVA